MSRALQAADLRSYFERPIHAIVAGKAASTMATALVQSDAVRLAEIVAIGTHRSSDMPHQVEWTTASHPLPDQRSVEAGDRAWAMAHRTEPNEGLLLLLSGGASSLVALPAAGISLDDKRVAIDRAMRHGADIYQLNAIRKHLSRIKGGGLAAVCRGTTLTLAVSDVVGDELSVIASGPGVADPSTWKDVAAFARTARVEWPHAVAARIRDGLAGRAEETPKPGDPRLARNVARVIAGRNDLLTGAKTTAESLGYDVVVLPEPVTGEARVAAERWSKEVTEVTQGKAHPICVLSAGETTVRVLGPGRGGRNQEFVLSLVETLARLRDEIQVASVGSDGIDGPTDAAGATATPATLARAQEMGLSPSAFLQANDAYDFFAPLGDLIHLGRTDTNVGDLQIFLSKGKNAV